MKSGAFKCKGERNDHMLHHEQMFGDVFKRGEGKCHAVLMKPCHKVKGEQMIIPQMVHQLKTKNIKDVTR